MLYSIRASYPPVKLQRQAPSPTLGSGVHSFVEEVAIAIAESSIPCLELFSFKLI